MADYALPGPVEESNESNRAATVGKDTLVVPHAPQLSDLRQP